MSAAEALLHCSSSSTSPDDASAYARFLAEFVGTFVLVAAVGCRASSLSSASWGTLAVGLVVMAMTYATAPVSGGNLNPAISVSRAMRGTLSWRTCLKYVAAQLLAGVLAHGFCSIFFVWKVASVGPHEPFDLGHCLLAELICTFVLCFVACSMEFERGKDSIHQFRALSTGLAVIAGGYSVQRISGSFFNPAVSLGLSLSRDALMHNGFIFSCVELLGAVLAAAAVGPFVNSRAGSGHPEARPSLLQRCVAECLGTFILVLIVGLNVVTSSSASFLSSAAALACMVYEFSGISGGHFNPAITLAMVASGKDHCSAHEGLNYVIAQIIGGSAAGKVFASFHAAGPNSNFTYGLGPGWDYSRVTAGVAELVFTCVLAYVALSSTRKQPWQRSHHQNCCRALTIGFCYLAGGLASGAISGGEINPAVAIGFSVASHSHHGAALPPPFSNCLFFSLWELSGALLATVVFSLLRPVHVHSEATKSSGFQTSW